MQNNLKKNLFLGSNLSKQEMKKIVGGSVSCTTLDGAGNSYSLACSSGVSESTCRMLNRQMCGFNCTFTICSGSSKV